MGAEIFTAVFILLAGQGVPGMPDPRQDPDYHRCMHATIAEFGYISPQTVRMDGFCAAVVFLSPSVKI